MDPSGKPHILVVDDDDGVRQLLELLLEDRGFVLHLVADALSASDACRKHPIDLMLLDKNLPDMNGIDLLRRIKGAGHDCAVIMMSAHASFAAADEAMKLGVTDFLVKPFDDVAYVLDRVEQTLKKRRGGAAAAASPTKGGEQGEKVTTVSGGAVLINRDKPKTPR